MSQKTELPPSEVRKVLPVGFLAGLVIVAGVVLVVAGWKQPLYENPLAEYHLRGMSALPLLQPWLIAGSHTLANGFAEFAGYQPTIVGPSLSFILLTMILVLGVFVPSFTLLMMGKRSAGFWSQLVRGTYLLCASIAMTFAVTILPSSILAHQERLRMYERQAVQKEKDLMINELCGIAWKVREYMILPKDIGGGDGDIQGYQLPASLTSTDLATYSLEPLMPGTAAQQPEKGAVLRAASKRYPGSEIETVLRGGRNCQLERWDYSGEFK